MLTTFMQYRSRNGIWEQLFEYIIKSEVFWNIVIVLSIFIIIKVVVKQHHSNWNHLLDGFNFSSKEFYTRLKEEINSHGIKNITSYVVDLKEGGLFSRRRRYLRIEWKEFQYDVCASPFGSNGFFISWWLLYNHSVLKLLIAKTPFIGGWLAQKWFPITYYKQDVASMFMSYAQSSVLKVIDDITKDKGVRTLTEDERKPMLNNIFKR